MPEAAGCDRPCLPRLRLEPASPCPKRKQPSTKAPLSPAHRIGPEDALTRCKMLDGNRHAESVEGTRQLSFDIDARSPERTFAKSMARSSDMQVQQRTRPYPPRASAFPFQFCLKITPAILFWAIAREMRLANKYRVSKMRLPFHRQTKPVDFTGIVRGSYLAT